MSYKFIIILLFLGIPACNSDTNGNYKKPWNDQKTIEILADAHLIEAAMQAVNQYQRDSLSTIYYQQLFEIHHTNKQELEQTIEYLAHNPQEMSDLYLKVVDQIKQKKK